MKLWKLLLISMIGILLIVGCEEDTDTDEALTASEAIVGTWLSTGDNIAQLLVYYFNYDSVRVEFTEDNIVTLESHVADGAWTTLPGIYSVTESEEGDIHVFTADYSAFVQTGIIQITDGDPDLLKLEAVQTEPDIGATVPTVDGGFGADPVLTTTNIQTYVRVE